MPTTTLSTAMTSASVTFTPISDTIAPLTETRFCLISSSAALRLQSPDRAIRTWRRSPSAWTSLARNDALGFGGPDSFLGGLFAPAGFDFLAGGLAGPV